VISHIPKLLGTWGLSTISMGKSASQERQAKERKFVEENDDNFELGKWVHEIQAGERKK
jgi:hypothetical protein